MAELRVVLRRPMKMAAVKKIFAKAFFPPDEGVVAELAEQPGMNPKLDAARVAGEKSLTKAFAAWCAARKLDPKDAKKGLASAFLAETMGITLMAVPIPRDRKQQAAMELAMREVARKHGLELYDERVDDFVALG